MDERMERLLKPGEQVRWTGKPERDPLLNANNKGRFLLRWLLAAVLGVGLTVGYALYCSGKNIEYYWAVNLVTVGAPLYVALLPVVDHARLRKVIYAVTSQRVLVSANPNRFVEMRLADVDGIETVPGKDGATLLLGSSVANAPEQKLRVLSLYGKSDEVCGKERTVGLALYKLADADIARACIIEGPQEDIEAPAAPETSKMHIPEEVGA